MATEYERTLKYIKSLIGTQGTGAGKPFKVLPWQRRFLKGFLSNQVSALSIARKNGKSTLLGAVACAAIDGPLAKPRAECLVVSGSFDQARIIFDCALAFLPDKSKYRIWDSGMRAEIMNEETGASLRCSASTARLLHGRQNHLILVDEPQSILQTQAEKIISALLTGMGAMNCRICFLGTRPFSPDHFFQKLLDEVADFSMSFSAPTHLVTNKPFNLKTIRMANPSYDYFPPLREAIRKGIERAKKDEVFLQQHQSLVLNGGVDDTIQNLLLQAATWENAEGNVPMDGDRIFAVDLGQDYSMSAIACYTPKSGSLEAFSAFPSTPALETRATRDGVGSLYQRLNRQGELLLLGEFSVDYGELFRTAVERWGKPSRIVCDSYRKADLYQALKDTGLIEVPVELRRWGPIDGSEDVRVFQRAVVDGKVIPKRSLLLRNSMSRVQVEVDGRNNWVIKKRHGDDPALASVLAVSSGVRIPPENEDLETYTLETFTL